MNDNEPELTGVQTARIASDLNARKKVSPAEIYNKFGTLAILGVLIIICSFLTPVFLSQINIINLLVQTAVVTMIACGITMVVITGNTDLSAGSMVALVGCIAVGTFKNMTEAGTGPFAAGAASIALAMVVGLALYGACGFIITRYRAPAFIVTLAVSTGARGLALMYTKAKVIVPIGSIANLGLGRVFGIVPIPVIAMVIIAVITWIILKQTRLGKHLYAIGGNREAAVAAGINTTAVIIQAYIIYAVFVTIAGIMFMARLNSGQPSEAVGLEFKAITAAIIGGTSLAGGIGTVTGTIIGSMIIGIISNVLTLLHVQSYYQQIITGVIIVLAVVIDIKTKGGVRK
jgi:inositol transport system permease protein